MLRTGMIQLILHNVWPRVETAWPCVEDSEVVDVQTNNAHVDVCADEVFVPPSSSHGLFGTVTVASFQQLRRRTQSQARSL